MSAHSIVPRYFRDHPRTRGEKTKNMIAHGLTNVNKEETKMAKQGLSETEEQQYLFEWARLAACKWPELALLYHIPNEGKRTAITGARLKSMGLKSGVPDVCLPVARAGAFTGFTWR